MQIKMALKPMLLAEVGIRMRCAEQCKCGVTLEGEVWRSSLVNTPPITKENKHTVVTEAPKKSACAAFALAN